MLFVMVMEVLNHLLDWIDQRGLLEPIGGLEHKVSLYADDLGTFHQARRAQPVGS
jgi:hypothetical protein